MRFSPSLLLGCLGVAACAQTPVKPTVLPRGAGVPTQGAGLRGFRQALARADVIYVGETHDSPRDHAYEAGVIRTLAGAALPSAVGWEMFDRSQQPLLDDWERGRLTLARLFRQTGFDRAWAPYSPWYARILDETRRLGVHNVALNAPAGLAHKVAQGTPLTPAEQAALPTGYATGEGAFQNFARMMGAHPGASDASLRRFFAAQSLWDQTMADTILDFHRRHPGTKLVVLTGRGHVADGYGIPSFVAQKSHLRQLIL